MINIPRLTAQRSGHQVVMIMPLFTIEWVTDFTMNVYMSNENPRITFPHTLN